LVYPEAARKNKIERIVRILTKIDINGNVLNTQVIQSLEGGDQAAIEAITKNQMDTWRKKCATRSFCLNPGGL
jgi:TonB family protein